MVVVDTVDLVVPPEARERLLRRFGAPAQVWCDELPGRIRALARCWSLEPVGHLGGGTSRVVVCRRVDGSRAYLKLTPDPVVAAQEEEALRLWDGSGRTSRLLGADPAAGVLLLAEVAGPDGAVAPTLHGARGVGLDRVAELFRVLRGYAPGPGSVLPSLAERVEFLFELTRRRTADAVRDSAGGVPVAAHIVEGCRRAALALARSGPAVLVHGDLHAGNVLDAGPRGLIAIDPRPAVGDPDFDGVDWVIEDAASEAETEERIRELAARVPGLDPDRLRGWCRATAVLIAGPRAARGADDPHTRMLLRFAERAAAEA